MCCSGLFCYPTNGIARWVFGINPDEFDADFTIFKLGQSNTVDFQFIESLTCQDFSFLQLENTTQDPISKNFLLISGLNRLASFLVNIGVDDISRR